SLAPLERPVSHLALGNHAAADACSRRHSLLRTLPRAFPRRACPRQSLRGRSCSPLVRPRLLFARAQSAKGRATNRSSPQWRFPATKAEALALPGVGKYTAAAILSMAYGQKLAVLDGNVARVLARLQAIRGNLRAGKRWQELQKSAEALLAPRAPGDWNQAIMELGAILCTPKSPQCLLCPVGEFCAARKLGLADA